jgi:hypothetical protein
MNEEREGNVGRERGMEREIRPGDVVLRRETLAVRWEQQM